MDVVMGEVGLEPDSGVAAYRDFTASKYVLGVKVQCPFLVHRSFVLRTAR